MNRKQIKRVRGNLRKIASQVVRAEVLKLYKTPVMTRVETKQLKKDGTYVVRNQNVNHYPCVECGELFRDNEIEVDHIEEVGQFKIEGKVRNTKYGDCRVTNWQEWMDKLFCSLDNFQPLCVQCHQRKTLGFNDYLRYGGNLL